MNLFIYNIKYKSECILKNTKGDNLRAACAPMTLMWIHHCVRAKCLCYCAVVSQQLGAEIIWEEIVHGDGCFFILGNDKERVELLCPSNGWVTCMVIFINFVIFIFGYPFKYLIGCFHYLPKQLFRGGIIGFNLFLLILKSYLYLRRGFIQ